MRSRNALTRALLCLCVAISCSLALGARANADDPPPRAIPSARGFERSFASYDAVIEYATAIARQQSALDLRLADAGAQLAATAAQLDDLHAERSRGGGLFDREGTPPAQARAAALVRSGATLSRTAQDLLVAGALTSEAAPWRMPTGGRVTQPFGPTDLFVEPSRVWNGVAHAHFHEGVDVAGAWAAPVVAPARGRVVFVGAMSDGAEIVVLAHDGDVVTLYAHLDARNSPPPLGAGDEVAAGQRIGTVGLTGITTGQHLHWAAWRDGALVDPLTLLGR